MSMCVCMCVNGQSNTTSLHTFSAPMFKGNNRGGSEERRGENAKDKRRRGSIKMRGETKRRRRKQSRGGGEGDRTQGIQGENDEESEGLAQRL